jgi:hypothetical protein
MDRAAVLVAGMVQSAPTAAAASLMTSLGAGHGLHPYIGN